MKKGDKLGMKYKSFALEDVNVDSRKISGYAAVFNNVDKVKDKLIKGCFSKSIAERGPQSNANDKIILLWQHDQKEPLGKITKLEETDEGLYFEAIIDEIEIGDRALKQLESGTLNQFSIGFSYDWEKYRYDSENDCNIISEVKLYEISIVTIGCNGATRYLGLKSVEEYEDAVDSLAKEIAEVSKHLSIQKQMKIQDIITKAMSLAANKPSISLDGKKADKQERITSMFDFKLKSL